jgi:hypothetical protein
MIPHELKVKQTLLLASPILLSFAPHIPMPQSSSIHCPSTIIILVMMGIIPQRS